MPDAEPDTMTPDDPDSTPEWANDRTSISVTTDLADELYGRKGRAESYENVIWRALEKADAFDADAEEA